MRRIRATPTGRAIWRWSASFWLCVAAHECGHMLAARRFGLIPKGCDPAAAHRRHALRRIAMRRNRSRRCGVVWQREIRLALIGPLVNLALACIRNRGVDRRGARG